MKKPSMSMAVFYKTQNYLLETILQSPRPSATLDSLLQEFKPANEYPASWRGAVYDQIIRFWINSDPAVTALFQKEIFNIDERRKMCYRAAIDYAMRNGQWRPEYRILADSFSEEQDGADRP